MEQNILSISLKEYKKEIDDLKASLLGLDKESEEYKKTLQEVRDRQNKLNSVLSDTKKSTDAAEGSMNQMKQQLKEWKSEIGNLNVGSDRFKELTAKIAETTNRLKELEAEQGTFGRNVGNYSNSIQDAAEKTGNFGNQSVSLKAQLREMQGQLAQMLANGIEPTDEAFVQLAAKAGTLKDAMSDAKTVIKDFANDNRIMENTIDIAKSGISVYGLYSSAMALFGDESEETQKRLQQLMAVQTALNSLEEVSKMLTDNTNIVNRAANAILEKLNITKKESAVVTKAEQVATEADTAAKVADTTATKGATLATKAFNLAVKSGPLIVLALLTTAISLLVNNWDKLTGAIRNSVSWIGKVTGLFKVLSTQEQEEARKYKAAAEARKKADAEINRSVATVMTNYNLLRASYVKCRTEVEKQQWIKNHRKELDALGFSITTVKNAETVFINQTKLFVQAMLDREIALIKVKQAAEQLIPLNDKKAQLEKKQLKDGRRLVTITDEQGLALKRYNVQVSKMDDKKLIHVNDSMADFMQKLGAKVKPNIDLGGFDIAAKEVKKAYNNYKSILAKADKDTEASIDKQIANITNGVVAAQEKAQESEAKIGKLGIKTTEDVGESASNVVKHVAKEAEDLSKIILDVQKLRTENALEGTSIEYHERIKLLKKECKEELKEVEKGSEKEEQIRLKYRILIYKEGVKWHEKERAVDEESYNDMLDNASQHFSIISDEYTKVLKQWKENGVKNWTNKIFDRLRGLLDADTGVFPQWWENATSEIKDNTALVDAIRKNITGAFEMLEYDQNINIDDFYSSIFMGDVEDTSQNREDVDKFFTAAFGKTPQSLLEGLDKFLQQYRSKLKEQSQKFLNEDTTKDNNNAIETLLGISPENTEKNINDIKDKIQSYYDWLVKEKEDNLNSIKILNQGDMTSTEEEKRAKEVKAEQELNDAKLQAAQNYVRDLGESLEEAENLRYDSELRQLYETKASQEEFEKAERQHWKNIENIHKSHKKKDADYYRQLTETARKYIDAVGGCFGAYADYLEADIELKVKNGEMTEDQAKDEFETVKKFRVAEAIISTLSEVAGTQVSVWTDKTIPFWGKVALSALYGTTSLMSGMARVKQIEATEYGSSSSESSSSSAGAASTVDFSAVSTNPLLDENQDLANTQNVNVVGNTTSSDNRVYLVESDIWNADKKNKVRVSETTF